MVCPPSLRIVCVSQGPPPFQRAPLVFPTTMKNPLILLVVSLGFALGAAALIWSSLDRASEDQRRTAAPVDLAPDPDRSLALRVDELVAENKALHDRLLALELRPLAAAGSRAPAIEDFVPREEFEAFRDEVHGALKDQSELATRLAKDPEGLKQQVASALTDVRRDEAVSKVRAKREGELERLDETMPKLEQWLGLTPDQSSEMRSALLAQYDRDAELIRRWEAGEDAEVLGELKRTNAESHSSDLSAILTPDQLETYSARRRRGGK